MTIATGKGKNVIAMQLITKYTHQPRHIPLQKETNAEQELCWIFSKMSALTVRILTSEIQSTTELNSGSNKNVFNPHVPTLPTA